MLVDKLNADLKRLGEEKSDGEGKWEEKYKLLEGQFETETAKNGALEQGIKELKENIEELNKKLADQKVKEEKDALEAARNLEDLENKTKEKMGELEGLEERKKSAEREIQEIMEEKERLKGDGSVEVEMEPANIEKLKADVEKLKDELRNKDQQLELEKEKTMKSTSKVEEGKKAAGLI